MKKFRDSLAKYPPRGIFYSGSSTTDRRVGKAPRREPWPTAGRERRRGGTMAATVVEGISKGYPHRCT